MTNAAKQKHASGQPGNQAALAETLEREGTPAAPLARGTTLGRYIVLEVLGRGGAGVVLAAFDPELERRVAIKLLAPSGGGPAATSEAQARLVREAQALAQLSHPAVVAVHDVGVHDVGVWLAMELVEGQTLAEWLRARRRGWRAVLEVFLRAGAGLQAAHAAGLVHRDFKPHNVMIAADGRVRVMDFGLARAERRSDAAASTSAGPQPSSSSLSIELTQIGEVVGTPGYMAPEQWLGDEADPRADQFAFCASLWEGLYGDDAFAGDTVSERRLAVVSGRRRPVPTNTSVPGWLRRAIERGLSREPERRWPSMSALLTVLAQGASRARRRRVAVAAVLTALAVAAVAGARAAGRAQLDAACRAQVAEIGVDYNPSIRAEIEAALRATHAHAAPAVAARIGPELDAQVGRWMATQYALCRARAGDPTMTTEFSERAQTCVRGVRGAIEGLVAALRTPDAGTVGRALPAIAGLPSIELCTRPDALAWRPAPPEDPTVRGAVDELRRELGRVRSLSAAGRAREADERARPLVARADALGWPPLAAEVRITAAELARETDDHAAAEAFLRDGLNLAAGAGEDALLATAAADLAEVLGSGKGRLDEALHWGRLAQAIVGRVGVAAPIEASVALRVAAIHRLRGDYDEAERLYVRAREILERFLGPDDPAVAVVLNNLATLAHARGDLEAARASYMRAMAIWEQRYGADHPDVAAALNNLGIIQAVRGRVGDAAAMFRRAGDTFSRAFGPSHPRVADALSNLAVIHDTLGEHDEARRLNLATLAIYERTSGPRHPDVGGALSSLAESAARRGAHDEVLVFAGRAVAILEQSLGDDNPALVIPLLLLASEQIARGAPDAAEPLLLRARSLQESAFGPEHPNLAQVYFGLGQLHRARARFDDAVSAFERAVAGFAARGESEHEGRARFALADILWTREADRPRALTLAREAMTLSGGSTTLPREVAAWLAARPSAGSGSPTLAPSPGAARGASTAPP